MKERISVPGLYKAIAACSSVLLLSCGPGQPQHLWTTQIDKQVQMLVFSQDGKKLAAMSADSGKFEILDIEKQKGVLAFPTLDRGRGAYYDFVDDVLISRHGPIRDGHEYSLEKVSSPSGKFKDVEREITSGTRKGRYNFVRVGDQIEVYSIHPYEKLATWDFRPRGLKVDPAQQVAAAIVGEELRVFSLPEGKTLRSKPMKPFLGGLLVDSASKTVLTTNEKKGSVWNYGSGRTHSFGLNLSAPYPLAISPDGQYGLFGGERGQAVLINLNTGSLAVELKTTIQAPSALVDAGAFSPDGSRFAVGYFSGEIQVWQR